MSVCAEVDLGEHPFIVEKDQKWVLKDICGYFPVLCYNLQNMPFEVKYLIT